VFINEFGEWFFVHAEFVVLQKNASCRHVIGTVFQQHQWRFPSARKSVTIGFYHMRETQRERERDENLRSKYPTDQSSKPTSHNKS